MSRKDEIMGLVKEFTICIMVKGDRLLLKHATRGVSKDKWVAPGGKIDDGESREANIIRDVYEETGYKLDRNRLFYHGKVDSIFPDDEAVYRVHVFSLGDFHGVEKQSTDEGELKWFRKNALPLRSMWRDYAIWLEYAYQRKRFDAVVHYASKAGDSIRRKDVNIRERLSSAR